MIIFGSVRFLPIKTTKPKFCKIQKIKPKPIQTDQFRFGYFILKIKTQPGFGSVRFDFGIVKFGLVILYEKAKTILFFGAFSDFLMGLVSVLFGFFLFDFFIFSVRFFSFKLMKPKPNQTKYFFKYSNWFNRVFFMVRCFWLFFSV